MRPGYTSHADLSQRRVLRALGRGGASRRDPRSPHLRRRHLDHRRQSSPGDPAHRRLLHRLTGGARLRERAPRALAGRIMDRMRALVLALLLFSSINVYADDYIENPEETASTDMKRRQTVMSLAVQGPHYPAKVFDPPCHEPFDCICRRLSADLPPGKKFVSIAPEPIDQPEYARFDDL